MIKALLNGILSSYALQAVQFILSIILVPFLLRETVLGVSGYGVVATLLSILSLLSLFTNGAKLEISRLIGRSVESGTIHNQLSESITVGFTLNCTLALIVCLSSSYLLSLIGVEGNNQTVVCVLFISLAFVAEGIFYPFSSYLHAVGKSYLVNLVSGVDVIVRNLLMMLVLYFYPRLDVYFSVFLFGYILKYFILFVISTKEGFGKSLIRPLFKIRKSIAFLMQCGLTSTQSLSSFFVYRLIIPITNRFLGAEVVGLLAILINVVRNYLLQFFVSAIRPIFLVFGARKLINELDEIKRDQLYVGLQIYVIGVMYVCSVLSFCSESVIQLWLGNNFLVLVEPFRIYIICIGLGISSLPKVLLMIANNKVVQLVKWTVPFSVITCLIVIVLAMMQMDWQYIVYVVSAYASVVTGTLVTFLFFHVHQEFDQKAIILALRNITYLSLSFGVVYFLSLYLSGDFCDVVFGLVVYTLIFALFSHLLIIRFRRVLDFIRDMRIHLLN